MAYTTEATVVTGTTITSSWANTYVRDNVEWIATNAPSARVFNSIAFSHSSSGSDLAVTFDSEVWDTANFHSTVSNTSRLTIPASSGGKYLIGGTVEWAASATGQRYIAVTRDGLTNKYAVQDHINLSAAVFRQSIVTAMNGSAADYFELAAFQNSGGTLAIGATNFYTPYWWAYWVSN